MLLEYAESSSGELLDFGDAKQLEYELVKLQVETDNDKDVPIVLYEAFVEGKITKQEFLDLKARYDYREAQQKERWVQLSVQKTEQAAMDAEKQELHTVLKKFQDTRILTRELIEMIVERIEVFDGERIYIGLKLQNS
jgi:hypothetical protein